MQYLLKLNDIEINYKLHKKNRYISSILAIV